MNNDRYPDLPRTWCNDLEIISGTDKTSSRPLVVISIKYKSKIYSCGFTSDVVLEIIKTLKSKNKKCIKDTKIYEFNL